MSLQKLLNRENSQERTEEANKLTKKQVTDLLGRWCQLYYENLQESYPSGPKERKMMKSFLSAIGYEKAMATIEYYLTNWKKIQYIKGYPTLNALLGFRDSLYMESQKGPRDNYERLTRLGQSTGKDETINEADSWV